MNRESMQPLESTITRQEFERLGSEWTALDNEYDSKFQEFVDNPGVKSAQEIAEFQAKQARLFEIETKLLKVAQGQIKLVN